MKKLLITGLCVVGLLTVPSMPAESHSDKLDECLVYEALKDARSVFGGYVPSECSTKN